MSYNCPICGEDIGPDQVLFVDRTFEKHYLDVRRYNELVGRFKEYPLEDLRNFRGLYFHVTDENVLARDANQFPTVIEVLVSDALTPCELEKELPPDQRVELPDHLPSEEKPSKSKEKIKLGDRACPHCHSSLPNRFGTIPTINVTMLGGRAAGKTAYLIAMIQQLQKQLTQYNLGTVRLLPESEAFIRLQINYYVDHGGVTMPTTTERLFPLVFEYNYNNGEETHACFIAIYDIAGEAVQNKENRANVRYLLNHRGIQEAQVALLVLDPNQLNNGAFKAAENRMQGIGSVVMEGHEPHDFFGTAIPDFLTNAITENRCLGILRNVRDVIALVTKIDQPITYEREIFATQNVLIMRDTGDIHNERVNDAALQRVEAELVHYFQYKLKRNLIKIITKAFESESGNSPVVSLLAVSTYTLNRSADGRMQFKNDYFESARKHRIIEPFLKLLAISNMVPVNAETMPVASTASDKSTPNKRGKRK
jgi:hypothetical protein